MKTTSKKSKRAMKHNSQASGYHLRTHSPKEWFREFGQRNNDGFAMLVGLSNEYRKKHTDPIPGSTAGRFFLAGYGCNNLPNWRTAHMINRFQNDLAILKLIGAPEFETAMALALITETLIDNANIRFANAPNRKEQVTSLKNRLVRELPDEREALEKIVAEPPLIYCEYGRMVQDNFHAQFDRSKYTSFNEEAISNFLGALGVAEDTNIIDAIAAIDDFSTAVLPLHQNDADLYVHLMTKAYQSLLLAHFDGQITTVDDNEIVLIGQKEINCEQLIVDLFKDGTDIGIYVAVLQILQDLVEANYHAVSSMRSMSAGITPSPENIKRADLERYSRPIEEDPTVS